MKCPLLYGNKIGYCGAVSGLVVVSACEMEKYCDEKGGQFMKCPVYLEKTKKKAAISVENYFSIYQGMM